MPYSKEYFELQSQFANKVSEVEGLDLAKALLEYTSFYKTFRIAGWKFDPNNETWQEYLSSLSNSDFLQTTYQFYLDRLQGSQDEETSKRFGCFTYEVDEKVKSVSVHFRNTDDPEPGALSRERMKTRMQELQDMFTEIKNLHPEVEEVNGWSWLYEVEAYTRLFPSEYILSKKQIRNWFKSTALWGQFLDSAGNVKPDLAHQFLVCISNKDKLDDLIDCFPLHLQEVSAPIDLFYEFYEI